MNQPWQNLFIVNAHPTGSLVSLLDLNILSLCWQRSIGTHMSDVGPNIREGLLEHQWVPIDELPVPACLRHQDGWMVAVNQPLADLLGVDQNEVIGAQPQLVISSRRDRRSQEHPTNG